MYQTSPNTVILWSGDLDQSVSMRSWSGSLPKRHLCVPTFNRYPARKFHRDTSTVFTDSVYPVDTDTVSIAYAHPHCTTRQRCLMRQNTTHYTGLTIYTKRRQYVRTKRMSARHFHIRSSNFQGFNDWRTNDLSESVIKHCQPLRSENLHSLQSVWQPNIKRVRENKQ